MKTLSLMSVGYQSTTCRLLDLPNGLHFRHHMVSCRQEHDPQWMNALAGKCSATLESLISLVTRTIQLFSFRTYANIFPRVKDAPLLFPIDPSTATSLEDAEFWSAKLNV